MQVRWIPQKEANEFVVRLHRHHGKFVGAITCVGAYDNGVLVGVSVLSRPVSRRIDYRSVVEVTRLCTDETKNACSKLYGASARIARELGFEKIQTYILQSESGVSLIAAGWQLEAENVGGESWNGRSHETVSLFGVDEKRPREKKKRYAKYFNN